MTAAFGILFAFITLLSWGVGDFFIQKTTRFVGSWKALFYIGFCGMILLFPFVFQKLHHLTSSHILLLVLVGIIAILAAVFDFEALRQGKISIIEPIIGLELPLTVGLSITLAQESLSGIQLCLIGIVFLGILLTITAHHPNKTEKKRSLEKGVILAGVGAIGMALTNFLVGVSSQTIDPLVTIWFTHTLLAILCLFYFLSQKTTHTLWTDFRSHPATILTQGILDNIAWVFFALSTTFIPISITTTISESYIALATLLGLIVNKEKIKRYQLIGISFAIFGVILLSYFSS
ncbi:MAG: hypothetical protein UU08_C0009G0031 [Candidatus Uhrbacteria bacterium GW2011_GWE2_40_58]|nr:MAG: hypothetical protein UT94_C0030G0005 [Candidatus Uhrbacteria bacterium GW2011_GWF2_40_263]KKR67769.1 MAG: hypothetical protein UU08_C0009G0031 [Candidatus Uhrbacteria bacterium GW2011_GWE2_40_58]OGL92209.1 MAG: hypothetical protein A2239_03075 [Candidatus Uhrbacteria bacterium RIFOXYA2_FULL_40_9]OGL96744.1 MAG: hypothetical protein A2332_00495 [Candidatus Uhrbacteria bacterium RIFOXYB2_FULL_41_18]HBK35283.1 hypothetical protein [Candidatus Uhrbacteria bacterium]